MDRAHLLFRHRRGLPILAFVSEANYPSLDMMYLAGKLTPANVRELRAALLNEQSCSEKARQA